MTKHLQKHNQILARQRRLKRLAEKSLKAAELCLGVLAPQDDDADHQKLRQTLQEFKESLASGSPDSVIETALVKLDLTIAEYASSLVGEVRTRLASILSENL